MAYNPHDSRRIAYKDRDIIEMISGGSYHRTTGMTCPNGERCITGIPTGDSPNCAWEQPYPFNITIGNRDLATMYKAKYRDFSHSVHNVPLPPGANAVKVFCIGAGGGGSGGNGGSRDTYRQRGNCSGSNMNRNWNWNSPYCNYYDAWHAPANGNLGAFGRYGEYRSAEFARNGNTYNVDIGHGGHGGHGGEWRRGRLGTAGGSGGTGGPTRFIMGNNSLTSNGGAGGWGTNNNWSPNTTNPRWNSPAGMPPISLQGGHSGNTSHNNGGYGHYGNNGFCRVYYLF
jgi:hypothetical protein